jgi:hypothetical protein
MSDIPPKPERLSRSATEAEKLERAAFMKERKRCQDKANSSKRAKGADRSQEEIGAVSTSNGKRAKRGGHGGHRDGTGRKLEQEQEQEAVVASTIRRGRAEYDVWRVKLCPNDETYVIQPKLNFHPIKSTSLSDIAAKVFMKYPTAEVP